MADPSEVYLVYDLAYELGLRPADVRAMPASEVVEWLAYFERKFASQE